MEKFKFLFLFKNLLFFILLITGAINSLIPGVSYHVEILFNNF